MGEGSYFPYILLNEMEMMFSQLAKQSSRVLPAVLCTDVAHCIINQRYNVNILRRNKIMVVEGGIVSYYCISFILVNCNFTDFMSLFRRIVCCGLSFSLCRVWNMQHIACEQAICCICWGKGFIYVSIYFSYMFHIGEVSYMLAICYICLGEGQKSWEEREGKGESLKTNL